MSDESDFSEDYNDYDEEINFDSEDDVDMGSESQQSEVDDDDFADLKASTQLKVYETSYKVVSAEQIEAKQKELSSRVVNVLGITMREAVVLLAAFKWHADSLIERYMEDADKVCATAGLPPMNTDSPPPTVQPAEESFMCMICCDSPSDRPGMKKFALSCGHELCTKCYGSYITLKIEEGQSRGIKCYGEKCNMSIDDDSVKQLVSREIFEKFIHRADNQYVDDSEIMTWCPAPDCRYAVECNVRRNDLDTHVPSVKCKCGHAFCFGCQLDDHMPCSCLLAKMWLQKCQDDSETSNWISANTKDCPKCHSCIEKNGGCNHMTCKKCKYEFCWMCMGDWVKHGQSYYNCSRWDASDSKNARTEQERSRAELERYLFYYNRYANHLQSLKLDTETFQRIQKKMKEMQVESGLSWIEVQFLHQSFEALQASRRTLTWTYAFAYYLEKSNETTLFEDNQQDLEHATEQLSEIFEMPAIDLAEKKVALLDKCRYVLSRREVLLTDATQGLLDGKWKYNVTLQR